MAEAGAKSFGAEITALAEKIVNLTIKDAQALVDCLKEVYGIEPAGGGVMMAAAPAAAETAKAEEKTAFDVFLVSAGEKKIQVIKVVRAATSLGLKEAKDLVDGAPKLVKEGLSKEDADKLKKELEESGAAVELR